MDQGIYTAAAGAKTMEERLAVISNNIANSNTTGFKKDAIAFEQYMRELDTEGLFPGQYSAVPVDVISQQYYIDTTQGGYQETGNPLDMALMGDGFFVVNTADGPRYTRSGAFQLSAEGLLTTAQGYTVQGEGGEIALAGGHVTVDDAGNVLLDGAVIDRLQVVDIQGADLERAGQGLFKVRDGAAPAAVETPQVKQGALESSNVEPVSEMVNLINTQRTYESFQKVIKSYSDTYSLSIRNVGMVA